MNNRSFTPPPAPDVPPVAPPRWTPATRRLRDRLGWWVACAAFLVGACVWFVLWYKWLDAGLAWEWAAAIGVPGLLALAGGLWWCLLVPVQDFNADRAKIAQWEQEQALRKAAVRRAIRTNEAWSRHWQRDKPPVEQVYRVEREGPPLSRLARETWEAARVIDAIPEPPAAPPWQPGALTDGRDTETLPALPAAPGPFDYYGTPGRPSAEWRIVDAALQDRPYGQRALGLTRGAHERAMARLIAGEVMIAPQGRGLPPTLAFHIARTRNDPALAHQLTATLLGAAPSPTATARARVDRSL